MSEGFLSDVTLFSLATVGLAATALAILRDFGQPGGRDGDPEGADLVGVRGALGEEQRPRAA